MRLKAKAKDLDPKAEAKDLDQKAEAEAEDLDLKAKAKDLDPKAEAKDLDPKAKAEDLDPKAEAKAKAKLLSPICCGFVELRPMILCRLFWGFNPNPLGYAPGFAAGSQLVHIMECSIY